MSRKTIYSDSFDREPRPNPGVEQIKEKKEISQREKQLQYLLQQERQANEKLTRRLRELESENARLKAKR